MNEKDNPVLSFNADDCPRCDTPLSRTAITHNRFYVDPKGRKDALLCVGEDGHVHMHGVIIAGSIRGLLKALLRSRVMRVRRRLGGLFRPWGGV